MVLMLMIVHLSHVTLEENVKTRRMDFSAFVLLDTKGKYVIKVYNLVKLYNYNESKIGYLITYIYTCKYS